LTPDDLLSASNNEASFLNYTKISPVEYAIDIKLEASNFLVFIENFNPLWKAKLTSDETHSYVAYHFVNAFYISSPGYYETIIYFEGQRYAILGQLITIISWPITVAFLIVQSKWNRFRTRRNHS